MRLTDVWLRYRRGGPWILSGVTAHLAEGDAAVVSGRNGAGKSTLLRLAAGLLRADRGTIVGRPARIGFVPERFPADQPFTARRYLKSMASISGAAVGSGNGIEWWAERLNLTALLDAPLAELSKGSAQKVGLIQALLPPPRLLILDEPWEGLDAQTREEIPAIIAELVAVGGRVLVSDHLGQTGNLQGLARWRLIDGRLTEEAQAHMEECVIEVAVPAEEAMATVARLRADGHRVVRVCPAERT